MSFHSVTGSLLEFTIDKNRCQYYCPQTNDYFPVPEGTILFEKSSETQLDLDIHSNLITFASKCRSTPRIKDDCISCNSKVICYIIIDLIQIFVCPLCNKAWKKNQ